jgi:hypothetical protein
MLDSLNGGTMTISAPANFAPTLPNVAQESTAAQQLAKADQKRAAEDEGNPNAATVELLTTHSDLAAMQLSRLQALTMSLGQSSSAPSKARDSEAIGSVGGGSRMDLYA